MDVDIDRIIELSRIRLESGKEHRFERQMRQIIAWVEEIDTISGTGELLEMELPCTPLQEDRFVDNGLGTSEALSNAPESDGHFFIVSEVIKK